MIIKKVNKTKIMSLTQSENKDYLTVLSDGLLHLTVPEGTEGAIKREYETSDGKSGVKYELVYKDVSGMITKVDFRDGEYGKSLQLTIEDEGEKPLILSLSTANNFGEDMMKKLPAIDMSKPVKIAPYSFIDDKGKSKKGVTVYQDDQKVQNYFYDPETEKNIHGYPTPKKPKGKNATLSKEEWKMYFMEVRIFLIDFITEKFNLDKEENF